MPISLVSLWFRFAILLKMTSLPPTLSEFIEYDGDPLVVLLGEDVVEQCGFSGAQTAGDDQHWDRRVLSRHQLRNTVLLVRHTSLCLHTRKQTDSFLIYI